MINRDLIRIKVIQLVYANFKNEPKNMEKAETEFLFSLTKSYELYHYLLLLIPEITDYAHILYDTACERAKTFGEREIPSPRFINNRFAAQLSNNKELNDFANNPSSHKWTESEGTVRALYQQIAKSSLYMKYLKADDDNYQEDCILWRHLYKRFIVHSESLDSLFEDWSIYWNDDRRIIDSYVIKTISSFEKTNGEAPQLLPAYNNDEDLDYAKELFSAVMLHHSEYEDLISEAANNWEYERMLTMDKVILVTAIAEIINFPSIAKSVTFNEYINLAKLYSTPKSYAYVNGVLDNVVKKLKLEHKLNK